LSKAINAVFGAVKQFYLASKRAPLKVESEEDEGQPHGSWYRKQAVDVPTFFKRRGLDVQFAKSWKGSKAQKRFERAMQGFAAALQQELAR